MAIVEIRYQTLGGATYTLSLTSNKFIFDEYYDNKSQSLISEFMPWGKEYQCNHLYIGIENLGTASIIDTITAIVYPRYASQTITNPTSSPVNTQGVPGLPSISGNITLPASTGTTIPGTQNITVSRLMISPGNFSGSTFPSNTFVWIMINGSLAGAIDVSGLTNGQWMTSQEYNFDTGITTTSTGIQLNPNIACAALTSVVTK